MCWFNASIVREMKIIVFLLVIGKVQWSKLFDGHSYLAQGVEQNGKRRNSTKVLN